MFNLPDAAIGAVLAAFIAGLVSLLGLIISKEQKISEFRQAWIDGLRSEVALLIGHTNNVQGLTVAHPERDLEKWKSIREDLLGANEASTKIKLRLNTEEHTAILASVDDIAGLLAGGHAPKLGELGAAQNKLVEQVGVLLKAEWVRVKNGEKVFRGAKLASIVMVVACALWLIALAGSSLFEAFTAHH